MISPSLLREPPSIETNPIHLGPISSTFYEQLLLSQISQVKQLFELLGSALVKAAHQNIGEIDPWGPASHDVDVEAE